MTKLSLIVPCYNEEQNVEAFYARCQEVFPTDQYEVVFVNDGSKDGTYKKLQKLHEEHDNILVVNFSRNFGKESAIYAGLHYASGSYISIIDADLQQDPEIVRNMVNILEEKPEKLPYNNHRIKYKHYGLLTEKLIEKIKETEDPEIKRVLTVLTANHMKKSFLTWNKDSVEYDQIYNDINTLYGGNIEMPEGMILSHSKDLLQKKNNKPMNNNNKQQKNNKKQFYKKHN